MVGYSRTLQLKKIQCKMLSEFFGFDNSGLTARSEPSKLVSRSSGGIDRIMYGTDENENVAPSESKRRHNTKKINPFDLSLYCQLNVHYEFA